MTDSLARAALRPGALAALLTAAGILGALLVLGFLGSLFSSLGILTDPSLPSGVGIGEIWRGQLVLALGGPVPIVVGVFFSFWLIAPIAESLRLAHVVTRALLATLVGGALLWLTHLVIWLLTEVSRAFGGDGLDALSPLQALFSTLGVLVTGLPVIVLGAVFLWGWLQRHPSKRRPAGMVDEV